MATLSSIVQGAIGYTAVNKAGDTMTGALSVPANASGTQVPQVQEVVKKSGDTMTGVLKVPSVQDAAGNLISVPSGVVMFFGNSTAPSGFLKCNGAAVSRTTYAALFAAIGTVYGAGDGSTTFNLPDLRGEFLRGWDDARGVDTSRAIGSFQDMDWKGFYVMNTGQNTTSYSHGEVYWGKSTTAYNGNTFAGGWSAPAAALGAKWDTSEIRPRNRALLACIKF